KYTICNTYTYIFYITFIVVFSSKLQHTSTKRDWRSDVCTSDLGPINEQTDHDLRIDATFFRVPDLTQIVFLLSLEVQSRHVIQQQRDARGGDTVGEALLRDLSPVVPLLGPGQAVEERVAVDDRDTELVEDSDAVG